MTSPSGTSQLTAGGREVHHRHDKHTVHTPPTGTKGMKPTITILQVGFNENQNVSIHGRPQICVTTDYNTHNPRDSRVTTMSQIDTSKVANRRPRFESEELKMGHSASTTCLSGKPLID